MALKTINHITTSGIDLAQGYGVVTQTQIVKLMNDRAVFNPTTQVEEVVLAHYSVTYAASIWKDEAARVAGLAPVESIGTTPGDLRFTTTDISTVFDACYAHLAEVLGVENQQS
jgi:hypothetical protein